MLTQLFFSLFCFFVCLPRCVNQREAILSFSSNEFPLCLFCISVKECLSVSPLVRALCVCVCVCVFVCVCVCLCVCVWWRVVWGGVCVWCCVCETATETALFNKRQDASSRHCVLN